MATYQDSPPPGGVFDGEVIELEPTVLLDLSAPEATEAGPRSVAPGIALVEGSLASLAGETHDLCTRRLRAAALFLAVTLGLVFVWSLINHHPSFPWMGPVTHALRCAVAVASFFILGRSGLSRAQVKGVEFFLFGSVIAMSAVNQYLGNVWLIQRDDYITAIALMKNGVLGSVILMVIYGVFIPNRPKVTARVVLTMALVHVLALVLAVEHAGPDEAIAVLRSTEQAGTNVLSLAIGAGLAIYAAHVLSGLRSDLHEARKFGQYQLRRKIGAGGMGEVYYAEHQLLKRPCALKLIKPESGANALALARFEREVQSAARLSHPNTIEIYDYGHTDGGTFYYVMEYLKGMSLADLVRQAGPLPPGRVIYLFRQAAAGLAEAHALGLVHRDLKPANLFIAVRGGETDVAKVLDFGLVKLTRDDGAVELTSDQTVSGTPMYMAPEQATGARDLDARADIYALGAMMYYCLTGRPPFEGDTPFALMMAHVRDEVPPPSTLRPGLPEDLEQVVLRCLAKKPDDRYPDARALGRALAACAAAADWDAERADEWWDAALRADPSLTAV
jgi:serine/threonine-protein kinase